MTNRVFCIGNGESRSSIDLNKLRPYGKIYGCNALYRNFTPDVLVAVDSGIIHEIYHSGYCDNNETWFRDWIPVSGTMYPQTVYGTIKNNELELIKKYFHNFNENEKGDRQNFTHNGSNLQSKLSIIRRWVNKPEAHNVMMKELNHTGVNVSWINPNDKVNTLKNLISSTGKSWKGACGSSSAWIACNNEKNLQEVYMIGHDLYSTENTLNNIYKGTKNYAVPENTPMNPKGWINQWATVMREYTNVKFYKVNPVGDIGSDKVNRKIEQWNNIKNLEYISTQMVVDKFVNV